MKVLKVGGFIMFTSGKHAGKLMKVTNIHCYSDSVSNWIRVTADPDERNPGDEVYIEIFDNDPRNVFAFELFEEFPASTKPGDPPLVITTNEEGSPEYVCMDPEATDKCNKGLEAEYTENYQRHSIVHWEYETSDMSRQLSVHCEDGYVKVFTGQMFNESSITVI